MKSLATGALILVLAALCVPGIESLRFRIPPYQDLMRSEGIAVFDVAREYKRGLPIGIRTSSGVLSATCRITSSDSQDCFAPKVRETLDGKRITILWSEQPIFLWKTEKRIFQLEVDGKVLITYPEMVARYQQGLPDWFAIGMSVMAFLCLVFLLIYIVVSKSNLRGH
jgi:hypothetical protein